MKHYLHVDWKIGLVGLTLIYFIGPVVLLAYLIQRLITASTWDWRDGWASVRAFSLLFGLFYLVSLAFLLLLLPPFASLEHLAVPIVQHASVLVASSLIPPGINHILIRWAFALPLAPALALLLERKDPHSGPQQYVRVALPGEIPEPERVLAEKLPPTTRIITPAQQPTGVQQPKRRRTSSGNTPPRKKKKAAPTPTIVLQEPGDQTTDPATAGPPQKTLWEQIDWSQVPDDDPVRQQATAEARKRRGMRIRYVQPPSEEVQPMALEKPPIEQEGQLPKPKKRIDWSQVDE